MANELSSRQHETIRKCLEAAAEGRFFPDWEFDTLVGTTREEVRVLAHAWPPNPIDQNALNVVASVLSNLIGYPHGEERRLQSLVAASTDELNALLSSLSP